MIPLGTGPPISRFLERDAPIGFGLGLCSVLSFFYDVFVLKNLTDKTVLLLLFTINTLSFALLADMIDKRTQ